MKTIVSVLLSITVVLGLTGCTYSMSNTDKQTQRPTNIDENNVGITKQEKADQTDPTLIEGNLEDNDLKN